MTRSACEKTCGQDAWEADLMLLLAAFAWATQIADRTI